MFSIIILCLISYILGSIPTGIWVGQHFYNTDIRQHGSGNTGTTNAFRVLGKKAGSIVLCIDILKGTLPTLLAVLFTSNTIHPLFIGLFAILGHTFSLFANFKGGKAVATSAGVVLAVYPLFILIGVALFLTTLYFSRMVSLSSILTATLLFLLSFLQPDMIFIIFTGLVTAFIIYRHRSNVSRIINGTESKTPFGWRYKK